MHFYNLLCHASTHSWKDFSAIAKSSLVTAVLMASESWKRVPLMTSLSLGKKKSHKGQIWRVGWLFQYSNVIFDRKLPNSQGIMSRSIVMMKQPWPCFPQLSSFLPHWAHQTSQDVFVDMLIDSLALWQEFCKDNSIDMKKKAISITLVLDLNTLAFLGLGDNALFLSRLCHLMSGVYSKIHDSSSTTTLFSKLGSVSRCSKMSWHTCTRHSFCPSFSNLGTIVAQIFLISRSSVMILHTLSLFIPSSSAIILTGKWWSLCTFCLTRSRF